MSRFSAGFKCAAPTATLPSIALYGVATSGGSIREIGVFNTTALNFDIVLQKFTTAGTATAITQGAGSQHNNNGAVPLCTARRDFTTTAPTKAAGDLGYRASIGAAIGAGIIWTFGETGLVVPAGTANGIGIVLESGTGQIAQCYIVWDE